MVYSGIKIVHQKMVELLEYINEICARERIQYFLDGGSNIGVVRHHGFVPWDDDIDISLAKKDYLKLIEILKKEKKVYFYFDDFCHHCCSFIFFQNEYWQIAKNGYFPSLYPIKLDIRPLNIIKDSEEDLRLNTVYRNCDEYILFGNIKNVSADTIKNTISDFGGKEKFLHFYNTEYGILDFSEGNLCSHPYFTYSVDKPIPIDWFFPVRNVNFENIKTFIPRTDEFLKAYYGDFMTFPPENEQTAYAVGLSKVKNSKIKKLSNLFISRQNNTLSFNGKIELKLMMKFCAEIIK